MKGAVLVHQPRVVARHRLVWDGDVVVLEVARPIGDHGAEVGEVPEERPVVVDGADLEWIVVDDRLDLRIIERSLKSHHAQALIAPRLAPLMRAVEVFGFHLAPMDRTHIDEIPQLIDKHGVASFKIFMFYGSHGLHGASDSQRDFLMIGPDERYDFAHFEFIMRGLQKAREQFSAASRMDQSISSTVVNTAMSRVAL